MTDKKTSSLSLRWQTLTKWYNASLFARIFAKIYGAVSSLWNKSLTVNAFRSQKDESNKGIMYKIFYIPFFILSLFATKKIKAIFDAFKKTYLYRAMYCLANNFIALSTRFIGVYLFCAAVVFSVACRRFLSPVTIGIFALCIIMCIFDVSLLRAVSGSIIDKFMKTFLSVEATFDYYDEEAFDYKGKLFVAAFFGIISGFVYAYV